MSEIEKIMDLIKENKSRKPRRKSGKRGKIMIIATVMIIFVLLSGIWAWYYVISFPTQKEFPAIPVEDVSVGERTVIYPPVPYQHYPKSEYDGVFWYWERLWKSHNYRNFTEEFEYGGKKYANISVSIYPYDFMAEDHFRFIINVTYHGYIGNLVKFNDGYCVHNANVNEWDQYELWIKTSHILYPGVVSLDKNRSVNYTTYIISGDESKISSPYLITGPTWWNLTYNITGDAENVGISVFESFTFFWIWPNASIPYAHIPLKFEFWVMDGKRILDFSMNITFKIPIILGSTYGIVLPDPKVNITKMENNSVRLEIEPTYYNYADIYIFWMDGNRTIAKSRVAWHIYTKPGRYPIMVFYSYRGKGTIPFYTLRKERYNFTFDGFQLSHIWNDDVLVEVSINA